jgi:hypothetical protein
MLRIVSRRNSATSNSRKPGGHGARTLSGRLYIAVLAAAVAAFFVVPVAQAAAGTAKVSIVGTGTGKVKEITLYTSSEPEPIRCPSICTGTMPEEFIALGAFAGENSEFVSWTVTKGTATLFCDGPEGEEPEFAKSIGEEFPEYAGMDGACFVEEVGGEVEITATFTKEVVPHNHLTVYKTGEGTVVISPGGIECTPAKNPCLFEGVELGAAVTLTASPASGWAFSSWTGCAEHVGLTCKVLLSNAKEIKVTFVATPSLTVEKAGSGYGKVAAMGISCDENCSKATSAIKTGASVTVKATPAKGSEGAVFEGGTGSASGCSGASCTFTISENSSVKVKFDAIPTKTLIVNLIGPGAYKGRVTGKSVVKGLYGLAIACGGGCTTQTESFFSSDEAILSAAAAAGYTFEGWSVSGGSAGTCTGVTTPCTVKTDANKTISAAFR